MCGRIPAGLQVLLKTFFGESHVSVQKEAENALGACLEFPEAKHAKVFNACFGNLFDPLEAPRTLLLPLGSRAPSNRV